MEGMSKENTGTVLEPAAEDGCATWWIIDKSSAPRAVCHHDCNPV